MYEYGLVVHRRLTTGGWVARGKLHTRACFRTTTYYILHSRLCASMPSIEFFSSNVCVHTTTAEVSIPAELTDTTLDLTQSDTCHRYKTSFAHHRRAAEVAAANDTMMNERTNERGSMMTMTMMPTRDSKRFLYPYKLHAALHISLVVFLVDSLLVGSTCSLDIVSGCFVSSPQIGGATDLIIYSHSSAINPQDRHVPAVAAAMMVFSYFTYGDEWQVLFA